MKADEKYIHLAKLILNTVGEDLVKQPFGPSNPLNDPANRPKRASSGGKPGGQRTLSLTAPTVTCVRHGDDGNYSKVPKLT